MACPLRGLYQEDKLFWSMFYNVGNLGSIKNMCNCDVSTHAELTVLSISCDASAELLPLA